MRRARLTGGVLAATAVIIPVAGALQPAHAAATPASAARSTTMGVVAVPTQRTSARASGEKAAWAERHKIGLKAVAKAKQKTGAPYVWGATGPNSFDCSGLVQWAYRKAGTKLPRVTYAQYRKFHRHKVAWKNLVVGDLVFFHGKGHVGIVSKRKGKQLWMIHAPSSGSYVQQVKLDRYRKQTFSGAVRPF
ncbi:MAG: C40 family peptidase [Actinomadura sp.]